MLPLPTPAPNPSYSAIVDKPTIKVWWTISTHLSTQSKTLCTRLVFSFCKIINLSPPLRRPSEIKNIRGE